MKRSYAAILAQGSDDSRPGVLSYGEGFLWVPTYVRRIVHRRLSALHRFSFNHVEIPRTLENHSNTHNSVS